MRVRAKLKCLAALSLATAIALSTVGNAMAATCSLNAQGVNFGGYDFLSDQNLDGVGYVTVTCDASSSYTIALNAGTAGSYAGRVMQSGSHKLRYNLYVDANHTVVWGDGSAGTETIGGSGTDTNYPVYGSVPAGQNPIVGDYSDVITVTLTF
jgi:spore coat protein U-like protein